MRHRTRFIPAFLSLTMLASAGTVAVTAIAVAPVQAAPACADVASTQSAALAVAAECRQPVVVQDAQSMYAQVIANPDGRLSFESSVIPQRRQKTDGSWQDVDLNLRAAGGAIRPVASAADVAFSDGGNEPLATIVKSGKAVTLSWPGPLPPPVIDGDSATYREVHPSVDLVVRATPTGFTHVLVIKTAAAAKSTAIQTIVLRTGGDAKLSRGADGSLRAAAGTTVVANAEPAVMWDSSMPRGGATRVGSETEKSTAAISGDAALTAPVATRITESGDLELTPDRKLLDDPRATFPIFVDPAWSVFKSKWAYASSDNCSNSDHSRARVGLSPEGPCVGSKFRSFFEFPTKSGSVSLKGKHIETARVETKLWHSYSCANTPATLWSTSLITATMKTSWSGTKLKKYLAAAQGHANKDTGCSDSPQADMAMNFINSAITTQVQAAATGSSANITMGLCACSANLGDESVSGRWKKFYPNNTKLVVDYDSVPGKPTSLQVSGVACPAAPSVLTVGTLSPKFSAVYPDADSGQTLVGTYEWIEVPAGGLATVTDTYPVRKPQPPNAPATANGRATTASVSAAKDKTYAFRVTAMDPAPYQKWSGWGAWCQFRVDTTVPPVTVTVVTPPAGPGEEGTFLIESTATDVTKFKYGWTAATREKPATGTTTKSVTVVANAPSYGRNIFYVSAVDGALNEGFNHTEVAVGRPAPAVARWGLETYPGQTLEQAVTDTQQAGGLTALTPSNLTWGWDKRLAGGQTAAFNGTSGQAVSAGTVVDTTQSFSVAAWVNLAELPLTTDVKAVAQTGADAAGFELGVRRQGSPLTPYWSFIMKDGTAQSSVTRAAIAPTPITSGDVDKWFHIVGTYDKEIATMRLYVNGVMVHETTRPNPPWAAAGPLVVGRSVTAGASLNWWKGNIADVQIFNRVLVTHDFTGRAADETQPDEINEPGVFAPIEVGRWQFELARPCYVQDRRDTCDAADGTPFNRWLALNRGAAVGNGQSGNALHLDGLFFPDENTEPWETTQEWGRSAVKMGSTPPDEDGNQTTLWQNRKVLTTDQSFTVSTWAFTTDDSTDQTIVAQSGVHESAFRIGFRAADKRWMFEVTDQDTTTSPQATVASSAPADIDSWTHLVAVYDAGRGEIRLYVDGELTGRTPITWRPLLTQGTLQVGRALRHDAQIGYLSGGIDELFIYQGAFTDMRTKNLYTEQLSEATEQ